MAGRIVVSFKSTDEDTELLNFVMSHSSTSGFVKDTLREAFNKSKNAGVISITPDQKPVALTPEIKEEPVVNHAEEENIESDVPNVTFNPFPKPLVEEEEEEEEEEIEDVPLQAMGKSSQKSSIENSKIDLSHVNKAQEDHIKKMRSNNANHGTYKFGDKDPYGKKDE